MKYDDLKRWDYDLWMRVGEIAMIILILSLHPANGQDLSYRQYTVKDGLPGSTVYHALQDQNGFMWFATNQGVSRFDGKAFKNYSKKDGLPDDEVLKLFVDRSNNVWLVSALGIASVIHNDSVTQFTKFPGVIAVAEDVLTDSVYFICKGDNNNGKYYAVYASLNKPDKWNFSGRVRDHYQEWPVLRASSPDKGINFYFLEKEGQGPVLLMKSSSWTTSHSFSCSINGIQRAFDPASFFCLTPDKAGLVFHTFDSLYYIKGNKKLALLPVKDLNMETGIPSVFCENDSTLWVCTRKQGILRIENFLTPQKHFTSFFEKSFCTSIMKDHEGGYWITTHSDGVYYLPNLNFRSLRVSGDIEPKNVKCITVLDQHTAAAGFDDGNVMLVNLKTLRTSLFGDWYTLNRNNRILNIAPYLNDHFLVAGDAGLFKLTRTGQYQKITNLLNAAKDVFVLPDSSIRIALTLGMVSTRPKEGKIFSGRVTCVNGIGTKCYWGTQQGVYTIVNGSPMNLGDKHKELRGIINHLAFAPDSSLWVSTQDGVAVLKDGIVTMIGKELGLPSNTCKHICFDRNTAWVSTNMGICRIDYQWKGSKLKLSISDITEEDGLISNDVNQTTTTEKHVWAATARGITFFDKDFVSQSIIRPLINITRVEAGKKVLAVSDTIILKYPENTMRIELAGISYHSGRRVHYEYRLKELNVRWNKLFNSTIEFTALPFGEFTLEVRAVDRWGEKSTSSKRITIVNVPPFWKSDRFIWFNYLTIASFLATGFYLFHKKQQQKKEREYERRKKMHELEMKAFQAQINPHFIFNCLASIQYHIVRSDIRSASTYLHKFSTLIRQNLQHSTSSTILLREELKILSLYLELEKLRMGNRLEYEIIVSEEVQQDILHIPSMIVQPYVENAIKHGVSPLKDRLGLVVVRFMQANSFIECFIEDNGPGIMAKKNEAFTNDYISMGTSITAARIRTINDTQERKISVKITDKMAAGLLESGTIVQLSFPL